MRDVALTAWVILILGAIGWPATLIFPIGALPRLRLLSAPTLGLAILSVVASILYFCGLSLETVSRVAAACAVTNLAILVFNHSTRLLMPNRRHMAVLVATIYAVLILLSP